MKLDAEEARRIAGRLVREYVLERSSLILDTGLRRTHVVGSEDPYDIIGGLHFILIRFLFVGDMETFSKLTSDIEASFGKEGVRTVTWFEDIDGRQIMLSHMRISCYVK